MYYRVFSICLLFVSCFFAFSAASMAQDDPLAYKVFNAKGRPSSYEDLFKEAAKADIVFFGELHNNPICHWLQLELTRDLYTRRRDDLLLGGEMFEVDNQVVINEYFLGFISENSFKTEARLWGNYATDYRPLLEFAKEQELRFVATNVPRRYASLVARKGLSALEELPSYSKIYLPPLPIQEDMDLGCYQKMLAMGDGNKLFPQAQMIKDATMAHNIFKNWEAGNLMLHYNGAFHTDYREGIVWYLRKMNPDLRILVISTVEQTKVDKLDPDNQQKGDYILCIPAKMTKTH